MPKSKSTTNEAATPSGLFSDRARLMGSANGLDLPAVDARLLWYVVQVLATRSASIQIGVTKDGGAWAVQYWDGSYPVKDYFNSTDELNRAWAALLRAAYKREMPAELDEIVRGYGW